MNRVLREEKKFLISADEFISLSHNLENIMLPDPHNGTHGYTIRSLYFDTVYDGDYFEKQAGIELRRKIRLRCYDPTADYAMLEMKQKQGVSQLKRSLKLKRRDAVLLTTGDYSPLLSYKEPFAAECYALMHSRDTVYIFWAIIIGICCGVGDYLVASVGSAVTFVAILILGCIKSDNRMLLIVRAARLKEPMIKSQVYKLFSGKAKLRVENTAPDTVELIYELTQKTVKKAEKSEPNIIDSIYRLENIEYVNLVMQNDEISN